jgi:hypothetical protein
MTLSNERQAELIELIDAVCNVTITPEKAARLEECLLHDGDAQWFYLQYIHLHGTLLWKQQSRSEQESLSQLKEWALSAPSIVGNLEQSPQVCKPATSPILTFLDNTLHGTISYFSSDWSVSYLVAAVIFGVGLLITSHIYISPPEQIAINSPSIAPALTPAVVQPERKFVGQVTGLVDCRWSNSCPAAYLGRRVAVGDGFMLASGLAEITYDTGAKVLLQGPVTYQVDSSRGGFLSVGKLTACLNHLPSPVIGKRAGGEGGQNSHNHDASQSPLTLVFSQKERGPANSNPPSPIPYPALFAVRTPTAVVTDLGTEFGVEVSENGETQSHVFRGSVQLQQTGVAEGSESPENTIVLHANEAAHVTIQCNRKPSSGEKSRVVTNAKASGLALARTEFNATAFVLPGQMDQYAEEQRLKPFRRWQAYSRELRKDPSLLAYYDFQMRDGNSQLLPNVAAHADRSSDGMIENARWTAGRMLGKQALLFNGHDDRAHIHLPQKTKDITLAAWVYLFSHGDGVSSGLLMGSWTQPSTIHWQIAQDGHIGFSGRGGNCDSPPSIIVYERFNQWIHLACTYDYTAETMRFYVNGAGVAELKYHVSLPFQIGDASIGKWSDVEDRCRNLRGLIDEVMVFGRPLAAEEIRRMYEQGKPEVAIPNQSAPAAEKTESK